MAKPRLVENRSWGVVPSRPEQAAQPVPEVVEGSSAVVVERADSAPGPATSERVRPLRAMRVVSEERVALIRRTMGVEVLNNPVKMDAVLDAIDSISEQTGRVVKAGVQIGRDLNAMLARLSEEEGHQALRASADLFPGWSWANLRKMSGAAKLLDSGWVDMSLLPQAHSVLYELSQLSEEAVRWAASSNLLAPSLTRIEAGRVRQLAQTHLVNTASASSPAPVHVVAKLPDDVVKLDGMIAELRAELKSVLAKRARAVANAARQRRAAAHGKVQPRPG